MRYMQTPSTFCTQGTLVLALLCLLASSAWGYRPFVSTDAAVVDSREVEIELGYFTLERTQGENTFTICSSVSNFFSRTSSTTVLPVSSDSFATSAALR